MPAMEFLDFLRTQRREPALSITIDWDDSMGVWTLRRLKAFLEDIVPQQKRHATVRATKEQKEGPILSQRDCRNAFASGVKWEEKT